MSDSHLGGRAAPSGRPPLRFFGIWAFPYVLAALGYLVGTFYGPASSLRSSVLTWPVSQDVYPWLLLMLLLAGGWLIAEFITVTDRETIVIALQWDSVLSALTAIAFTGVAGWLIGTGKLEWWFVVPWVAAVLDSMTSSWLGINNAAQKPFLSQKGTM